MGAPTQVNGGNKRPFAGDGDSHDFKHHRLESRQTINGQIEATTHSSEDVRRYISESIAVVLNHLGYTEAEPLAMESFRMLVEEYMSHFLSFVRRSMLASRRTQPVAADFTSALEANQLTLRALLLHLDPPIDRRLLQKALVQQPPVEERIHFSLSFQHEDSTATGRATHQFIPAHLPSLPSQHTYKATPVYPTREDDPRIVREKAAEDARKVEDSLRRLALVIPDSMKTFKSKDPAKMTYREQAMLMWKDLMEQSVDTVVGAPREEGAFENDVDRKLEREHLLRPPVNSESMYWRKPARLAQPAKPANGVDAN